MKDPYTQPLESFSFDEMADALDAIASETAQLDFKEIMIPSPELAYRACAFANADGGLIVIGIKDPIEGQPLAFASPVPATDDKERMRVLAAINARTHPALPLDAIGYRSNEGNKGILVIRIRYSVGAPHEYTIGDHKHNLPVRRGTSTERLGLGEIAMLQMRREGGRTESPIHPKRLPYFSIQPANPKDGFIGVMITPRTYSEKRRVLDDLDEQLSMDVDVATRGPENSIHDAFEIMSLPDSNVMLNRSWLVTDFVGPRDPMRYTGPPEQMEIFSDGDIIFRRAATEETYSATQFIGTLLWAYTAAQQVYQAFGLPPEIRLSLISRSSDSGIAGGSQDAYDDWFNLNLATQSFAEAFVDTMIRFSRSARRPGNRKTIFEMLEQASTETLPFGDKLRASWFAG